MYLLCRPEINVKFVMKHSQQLFDDLFLVKSFVFGLFLCSLTLCENLLDSLLFFQKKGSNNSLAHTLCTKTSTIGSGHSSLPLLEVLVIRSLYVLDSLKGQFAITASRSLGLFDHNLGTEFASRSPDGLDLVGSGVVRLTADACVATISHYWKIETKSPKFANSFSKTLKQDLIHWETQVFSPHFLLLWLYCTKKCNDLLHLTISYQTDR